MKVLLFALAALASLALPAAAMPDNAGLPKLYCLRQATPPTLADKDVNPFPCDANGIPLVNGTGGAGAGAGTPADNGSTIAAGGTAQTAIAANPARKGALCENPAGASEPLFVSITGAATVAGAGNLTDLNPGGSVTILGGTAVSVNAATNGHRYYCTEWQ